jgi:hypothetical protein
VPTVTFYPVNGSGLNWTNPQNGYTDNDVYATSVPAKNATTSVVYVFDFSTIPENATVTALSFTVDWYMSSVVSNGLTLRATAIDFTEPFGSELTNTTATSPTTQTQATSLVEAADLRDGAIQMQIQAQRGSTNTNVTAYLDYVSMTVEYSAATNTPKTLSTTVRPTSNIPRAATKTLLATVSSVASMVRDAVVVVRGNIARAITTTKTATVRPTATIPRGIARTITAISRATATIARAVESGGLAFYKTLTTTVQNTPNMVRAFGLSKILTTSVSATGVITRIKGLSKVLTTTVRISSVIPRAISVRKTSTVYLSASFTLQSVINIVWGYLKMNKVTRPILKIFVKEDDTLYEVTKIYGKE